VAFGASSRCESDPKRSITARFGICGEGRLIPSLWEVDSWGDSRIGRQETPGLIVGAYADASVAPLLTGLGLANGLSLALPPIRRILGMRRVFRGEVCDRRLWQLLAQIWEPADDPEDRRAGLVMFLGMRPHLQ
jgi:hypothetical protein